MSTRRASPFQTDDKSGQRLEDLVYGKILDDIRLGRYSLGQKLPSENDLATEQGVSRPVVRAALAKLREGGLIVSRQGAGSYVSSGDQDTAGFGPLSSIDDIGRYFEFRKLLESETAARAAARSDGMAMLRLRQNLEALDARVSEGAASVDLDFEFHMLIANLSDNRFLTDTLAMLRPQWYFIGKFVRSLSQTGYRTGKRHMLEEHRAILAGIEAADQSAARAAMIEHIAGSERRVFKGEQA